MDVLIILMIWLGIYFLPTIIAYSRNKDNRVAILLVNFLAGWTMIGWLVALVWSVMVDKK